MKISVFFLGVMAVVLMLPVLMVSWFFSEPHFFALSMGFVFGVCFLCVLSFLMHFCIPNVFQFSIGYDCVLLVLIWLGTSLFGSLVFLLYGLDITWVDAFFACVSGLTTTGAEVFSNLSVLPHSLLFYRMWLQFLGGLGIVLMAVTAFSSGGGGVSRGIKFDLPGPVVSYSKKKPKLSDMAGSLWTIYMLATVLCAVCLRVLGLDWFEAMCESFSIVSTGGYNFYADGVNHYHSYGVKLIMMVFMLFGSVNFLLHYQFFFLREYFGYVKNIEMKSYVMLLFVVVSFFLVVVSFYSMRYDPVDIVFTVVSMFSSSGFMVTDLSSFPPMLSCVLVFLGVIGGLSGSTSGGIKIIRLQYCYQEISDACRLLLHPRLVLSNPAVSVGMSGSSVDAKVVIMRGFITAFIGFFLLSIFVLTGLGLGFQDAFFSMCACFSNTGVFLSDGSAFSSFPATVKLWLAFSMLLGRIEILAFLVILSPSYWSGR
ncbi:MAG: potassium transporter TrkG [Pseudomonadota bacterium]|nr:potassium transporter TrkG [Pseudomonadota bacterium]